MRIVVHRECPQYVKRVSRLSKSELRKALEPDASRDEIDEAYFGMKSLLDEMRRATSVQYVKDYECADFSDHYMPGGRCAADGMKLHCGCPNGDNLTLDAKQAKNYARQRCVEGEPEEFTSDVLFPVPQFELEYRAGNIDFVGGPNEKVEAFYKARSLDEKVATLNSVIQEIHGRGPVAHFFVHGGVKTLNELSDVSLRQHIEDLMRSDEETVIQKSLGLLDYAPEEVRALPRNMREFVVAALRERWDPMGLGPRAIATSPVRKEARMVRLKEFLKVLSGA